MSSIGPAPRSFQDGLYWVRCSGCFKPYSPTENFYIFSCLTNWCHGCVSNMFDRNGGNGNRLNCVHCKKVVSFCPIRDQMPANIRKMFIPPMQMAEDIVRAHQFKQNACALIQNRMIAQREHFKRVYNETRYQIQRHEREIDKIEASSKPYAEQILKVIPQARLDYLIEHFTEEEIQNMTYGEMVGVKPSTQTNRRHEPMNMSSTPASFRSFGPRESGSDFSGRHDPNQRWNNNYGNTGYENAQTPRRRRSRYDSRENRQGGQCQRDPRPSQHYPVYEEPMPQASRQRNRRPSQFE